MKYQDYRLMSKEKRKKLVPKLRFPDFIGSAEWKKKSLGDIGNILMCKRVFANETSDKGEVPFFKIGTLGGKPDTFISRELFELYKTNYSYPRKGEILITCSGTVGKCIIYDGVDAYYQDSNIVWISNPTSEINNGLLYYLISNVNWEKLNSTTITRIYGSDLRSLKVSFPAFMEQQKIVECLSSLDDLIAAENEKLELLIAHKKGLIQNLFPQEGETAPKIRYPEFKEAGDWEEKILGDIAELLKGKGISKSDIVLAGILPCIRYGELYTHYNETINTIISYTNQSAESLVLSKVNDVIIPSSGETREDIATASCIMMSGIAIGGDINIIRSQVNGVFLSYYLNNAKKKAISKLAQGDAVVHLYNSQLQKLSITIPNSKEQQKIADCLSSLDEQIDSQSERIEALKSHKKGLLQQLFPSTNDLPS